MVVDNGESMVLRSRGRKWILIAIVLAMIGLFPLMPFADKYFIYIAQVIGLFLIVALGLNFLFGNCGLVNFGGAGFYALGAYISTLLETRVGLHLFMSLPLTIAICALVTLVLSYPLLRLRHYSFALGSFAFALVIWLLAERWVKYTGGEDGLVVPKVLVYGNQVGDIFYYYLIMAFVIICFLICHFLNSSRVGRAMKAIRDDELVASSMGIDVARYMRLGFLISGIFGGLGGILFSHQSGWIASATFGIHTNVIFIIMVMVGGIGSNFGMVLGALIITVLPEFLAGMEQYQVLAYGVILAVVIRFLPQGVAGWFASITPALRAYLARSLLGRMVNSSSKVYRLAKRE